MAIDMPDPCKFPSLENCQKRFPRTHKEVDLTPHPVVGLVLKVGGAEKFPRHLVSKAWILFFLSFFLSESASRFHVSQPHRRMEVTRYL